jgi:predicted DNA-binding transcriptional regulator AlpA
MEKRMSSGFYDKDTVMNLTTLSGTTIWRSIKEGTFPAAVQISRGRVAWPRLAVDQWLEAKASAGEAPSSTGAA